MAQKQVITLVVLLGLSTNITVWRIYMIVRLFVTFQNWTCNYNFVMTHLASDHQSGPNKRIILSYAAMHQFFQPINTWVWSVSYHVICTQWGEVSTHTKCNFLPSISYYIYWCKTDSYGHRLHMFNPRYSSIDWCMTCLLNNRSVSKLQTPFTT